ncbi:MAG: PQQ-binding-like beta-propeller repeat protein [Candidatus Celaenobacter polaris]|nr:PQQ-binding-like beta-propeller repeat protein [Candidatus Celaenobacter polaris]
MWKFDTGGEIDSSPAISDGIVYIGIEDGYLYALE